MKSLIVNNKFDNKNLLFLLMHEFQSVPKSVFYKALRKKDIRLNNIKISEDVIVHEGDEIKLYILDKYFSPSHSLINIVYEDDNILILNKPKGIEVTGENSLTAILTLQGYSIFPCHRLDRNTEGLIIFAKSETALNILLKKFKLGEITKYYRCKVYGIPNKKHDILTAYLFKDNKKSLVYIREKYQKGYKKIITEYNVQEENPSKNTSVLEIILHTGRTHQIRAHLAFIGFPIIRRPENMGIIR